MPELIWHSDHFTPSIWNNGFYTVAWIRMAETEITGKMLYSNHLFHCIYVTKHEWFGLNSYSVLLTSIFFHSRMYYITFELIDTICTRGHIREMKRWRLHTAPGFGSCEICFLDCDWLILVIRFSWTCCLLEKVICWHNLPRGRLLLWFRALFIQFCVLIIDKVSTTRSGLVSVHLVFIFKH